MKITKLDRVFSEYIRQRDSDENGYGRCIACGKVVHWKNADCGHYINRRHMSLRFNEINCNLSCRYCNRFDEGNLPAYGLALQKKYGNDIIKRLLVAKNEGRKYTQFEIDTLTEYYKQKIKHFRTPFLQLSTSFTTPILMYYHIKVIKCNVKQLRLIAFMIIMLPSNFYMFY